MFPFTVMRVHWNYINSITRNGNRNLLTDLYIKVNNLSLRKGNYLISNIAKENTVSLVTMQKNVNTINSYIFETEQNEEFSLFFIGR